MSKSRQKGTSFETLIKEYFISKGLKAHRNPLSGSKDVGDVWIENISAVFECKNCVKLNLSGWIEETEVERKNAGRRFGFTIFKRKGKGRAEDQYALMPVSTLVELLKIAYPDSYTSK